MEKIAFKMILRPGCKDEYVARHRALWPELAALLKEAGVSDYTIFLDEATHTLFAVQLTTGAASSQDLRTHPVVQRWWAYMADLMETNPDQSPVSVPLEKVFHLP
jgi:L-rhamnose mutarotase